MARRGDFHDLMRDNLAGWGIRLERVKARLETQPASDREKHRRLLDDWTIRCAAGVATLDELESLGTADQWDVLKLEMATLWHDLDTFMAEVEKIA